MDVLVWMANQVFLGHLVKGVILVNREIQGETVYQELEGDRAPQGLSGPQALQGRLVKQVKMANLGLLAKWARMVCQVKMGERVTKENQEQPEEMAVTG